MTIPIDTAAVSWREIDGEIVVLDERTSVYFGLNHSAAVLWKRLVDGADESDLVQVLITSGVDPEQAVDDAAAFLDGLREQGILEPE